MSPLHGPHLRPVSLTCCICVSLCVCASPSLSQGKVAQTACMSACKHISTSLMQLLLDPEVRQISMGALYQIHTDILECESEHQPFFLSFFFYHLFAFLHSHLCLIY